MKKLKFVILGVVLALSNIAFSFTVPNKNIDVMTPISISSDAFNTTTKSYIPYKMDNGFLNSSHDYFDQYVNYPDFAIQQHIEGVVAITMRFNSYGNVEIIDSFSNDIKLENYVNDKLSSIHLKDCSVQINKPYNIKFTFRLI